MSIPEACIEAAFFGVMNPRELLETRKERARRVINALAEHLPESAVEKAREAYRAAWDVATNESEIDAAMDDAIIAALRHVVEVE